ncbi:ComEC/Rec2 family competence protein [Kitasatospora sp. MAP5-34]|uniref:ComEC/Rec2 family competence protein n=1 Tax=Kitasatospora sp. MAP5-34 TaxID=3035102 RepID=UPI002472F667|nr:ComEC/Rec2 family competence protein [Kitasatospora sp. MAP5-34]MDH6574797.1 competence protein ComEC [Kitasatospora sp. MAP5-34]
MEVTPIPASTGRSGHRRRPADVRLVVPAVSAWAVAVTVLGLDPGWRPVLLLAAGVAVVAALLLLLLAAGRDRHPAILVAATLLTAAAGTVTTVLHTADLYRGPLVLLARQPHPELTVELTVAGDPKARHSPSSGTGPGKSLLTVSATVDVVRQPEAVPPLAEVVRTRTPVILLIREQDAPDWQQMLPSTRLGVDVRVLPADPAPGSAVGAVLLVRGPPRLLAPPSLPQRLAGRLRAGLRAACDHLPPDTRGLLPGLVVGDTSRISEELNDSFRATDLGHLTAVSGANLAIVLAVLIGAPGRAGEPDRTGLAGLLGLPLRTTALLGALLTLAFVTICRPDPSVLRAAATGLIAMLALATGRPRQALPALAGAVLVLVLLDPYLARSYGFMLSTLATAGLLVLGPPWTAALLARRWPHHLATAVASTAAAQAFCGPVTVLLAPKVSLVAIPCNALAELAITPVTLLGFAALVVDPLWHAAARFLVDLAALPTAWLVAVAEYGAALPGAQLELPSGLLGAATLALLTLALAWAARPLLARRRAARPEPTQPELHGSEPTRPGLTHPEPLHFGPRHFGPGPLLARRWLRVVLALAAGLALLTVLLRPPLLVRIATGWPPPGWRLVMCDVGQGDMTVLPLTSAGGEAPDTAVVVDAGPDPKAADSCLRALGITRVSLLIVTHFHADHSEGLPGVLHGRSVGALQVTTLDSPPGERARVLGLAAAAHVPVIQARRGEHRTAGPELSWEILWPDDQLGLDTPGANNSSVALLASVGPPSDPLRVALLGDLEPPAQAALHDRQPLSHVDVLKVAHHGSANQDWDFEGSLSPRLALISCGLDNSYGHPAPRTVDRLRALGATVLRTDRSGDIAVLGSHSHLQAATHPHRHPPGPPHRAAPTRPPPG